MVIPVLQRRDATCVLEEVVEMTGALEANRGGNFFDAHTGSFQEFGRFRHSGLLEVLSRRDAGLPLEEPAEVAGGEVDGARQFIDGEVGLKLEPDHP